MIRNRSIKIEYLYKWETIKSIPISIGKNNSFFRIEKYLFSAGIKSRVRKGKFNYNLQVPLKYSSVAKEYVNGNVSAIVGAPVSELIQFDEDLKLRDPRALIDPNDRGMARVNVKRSILFMLISMLIIFTVAFFVIPR